MTSARTRATIAFLVILVLLGVALIVETAIVGGGFGYLVGALSSCRPAAWWLYLFVAVSGQENPRS